MEHETHHQPSGKSKSPDSPLTAGHCRADGTTIRSSIGLAVITAIELDGPLPGHPFEPDRQTRS